MIALRMIDAAFRSAGRAAVGPLEVALEAGCAQTLRFADAAQASLAARLAAALVKTTSGTVLVGDFDPKVQPVQAKRLIGFVPAQPGPPRFAGLDAYFAFRADLWEVERAGAIARARSILAAGGQPGDPYLIALAGSLIRPCALIVLDQPPPAYEAIAGGALAEGAALFVTRTA